MTDRDESITAALDALARRRAKVDQRAKLRAKRANQRVERKAPLLLHAGVIERVTPERARADIERIDAGVERRILEDAKRDDGQAEIARTREAVLDHIRATGHAAADDLIAGLQSHVEGFPNKLEYRRWYWLNVLAGKLMPPEDVRGVFAGRFEAPEACAELLEVVIDEDAAEALGWHRPPPPCWKTMARISPTVLRAQLDRDPALRAQIEAELEAEQEALDATHGVQLDMLDSMEAS